MAALGRIGVAAILVVWTAAALAGEIKVKDWGQTPDGKKVQLFSLDNGRGLKADITNYGAIVVRLWTRDRAGKMSDVVLGYNTVDEYIKDTPYFGAIVGRYGNRIAHGKFRLDGKEYKLATNN